MRPCKKNMGVGRGGEGAYGRYEGDEVNAQDLSRKIEWKISSYRLNIVLNN